MYRHWYWVLFIYAATACGQDDCPDPFKSEFLKSHNEVRAEKNLPDLKWDKTLQRFAQNWSNYLASNGCEMVHSKSGYGENLAMYWGSRLPSPLTVVGWWADEERFYDYDHNICLPGKSCGHYTQLVWRSTTSVGCAVARCPDGNRPYLWTCSYDPPGNFKGQKPY